MDILLKIWNWLKFNDLPNWIVVIFSIIIWPLALFLWSKRVVGAVRNLQVVIVPAGGIIPTGQQCPYLVLKFNNNTGAVVYLSNLAIKVSYRVRVHPDADKDVSTGNHVLKFAIKDGDAFNKLQATIDTGQKITTGLPLSNSYNDSEIKTLMAQMRSHKRNGVISKFFTLQFDCMIGRDLKRVWFKF